VGVVCGVCVCVCGVVYVWCVCVWCVWCFSLQLLPETCLVLRRIRRDIITIAHGSTCKISASPVRV